MLGVSLQEDGVGLAHVVQPKDAMPRLVFHTFAACEPAERAATLGRLLKQHRLTGVPCCYVLEPDAYQLLQVEAPDVDPSELKSALRWRVKDLIDFHVDDAVLDVFEFPGQDQPGRARMMYVVAAKLSTLQARVDLLHEAKANLSIIDIPELALRNVAQQLPEDQGGLALLALKRHVGLIVLTRQQALYLARHLDVGFASLTTDEQATQGNLATASSQRLEELVLELQRSLDYYDRYFRLGTVNGIVIAPTGDDPSALVQGVGDQIGLPTYALDLNDAIDSQQPLGAEEQARLLESIGAALRTERKSL